MLFLPTDKTMAPERSFVEITPDPQKASDRPEWCFVYYDSTYHPSRTFQFEFQWVVSTAALISQLVRMYSMKLLLAVNTLFIKLPYSIYVDAYRINSVNFSKTIKAVQFVISNSKLVACVVLLGSELES